MAGIGSGALAAGSGFADAGVTGGAASAPDGAVVGGSDAALDVDDDASVGDTDPFRTPRWKPLDTHGSPLTAAQGTWTYTEFADTQCRDGSPAGLYVSAGSVDKLMIFLEGGGRCAEAQSCAISPASVAAGSVIRAASSSGVLDRTRRDNPVRDWSFVYVPYCTGDRHGGANPDGDIPGVGPQKFVGYLNMQRFLDRIVPTFPRVSDVLLTGISAGGFGVAYNSVLVQRAFPALKVKIVIDSAPFVTTAVFTPCDQRQTRQFYRAEQTFLGDCGTACPNHDDYWMDYGVFLARAFSDRPLGLISSTADVVERGLFGIGSDDCNGNLDLLNPSLPAATFRADILAYRAKLSSFPNAATFYPDTDTHSFLVFDEFYTATAGGVRLLDWFTKIVSGESPGHAGP